MWIYLDLKTKVKETLTSRKRTRCNAPLCRLKKESISVSNPTLFLVLSFLTDSWEDNADSWRRASHINECLPSFGDIPKAKEDTWEMQDEASENSQSNRWKHDAMQEFSDSGIPEKSTNILSAADRSTELCIYLYWEILFSFLYTSCSCCMNNCHAL